MMIFDCFRQFIPKAIGLNRRDSVNLVYKSGPKMVCLQGTEEQISLDRQLSSDQKQHTQSKMNVLMGNPESLKSLSLPVSCQSIQTNCIKTRLIHHGGLHYLSPYSHHAFGRNAVLSSKCALMCLELVLFAQKNATVGYVSLYSKQKHRYIFIYLIYILLYMSTYWNCIGI